MCATSLAVYKPLKISASADKEKPRPSGGVFLLSCQLLKDIVWSALARRAATPLDSAFERTGAGRSATVPSLQFFVARRLVEHLNVTCSPLLELYLYFFARFINARNQSIAEFLVFLKRTYCGIAALAQLGTVHRKPRTLFFDDACIDGGVDH